MQVNPGTWYVVTTDSSCTVTDANGKTLCTAVAGTQKPFLATTMEVTLSDAGATVTKSTFNAALAMLGQSGEGGNTSSLPTGYTLLEFVECDYHSYVDTQLTVSPTIGAKYKVWRNSATNYMVLAGNMAVAYDTNTFYPFISNQTCIGININGSQYILKSGGFTSSSSNIASVGVAIKNEFVEGCVNWLNDGQLSIKSVSFTETRALPAAISSSSSSLYLGNQGAIGFNGFRGRIYNFNISDSSRIISSCMPVIDSEGNPCFYDTVRDMPLPNIGTAAFIAGFSLAGARKIGRLPAGIQMTIYLPSGWEDDAEVVAARAIAEAKGCILEVRTYSEEQSVATYSFNRIWVRRTKDDDGSYVDADNTHWRIDWCDTVIGADPESLGYERFRNVEVAAEYWGLTPVMAIEEDLTETE